MQRSLPIWWLAWVMVSACSTSSPSDEACADEPATASAATIDAGAYPFQILVYTYSTGFRHASIPAGIRAMRGLGVANGFGVDIAGTARNASGSYCANRPEAADAAIFTTAQLARYAAIVFLSTTSTAESPLLDEAGKAALEAYVRAGGGFVGIHAASDAERAWPFYEELLGATFLAHGPPVTASLVVEDAAHPATSALPNPWSRYDEWFDFTANPRPTVHVLMHLDEATYPDNPAPMGDHPIAWCKTVGAGHSFYTALGHTTESWSEPLMLDHLLGGIRYAAGVAAADCQP